MNFSASLRSFYKPYSKKFGLSLWVPILIHRYENTSRYDTVSFSNLATMILVRWLSQITHTGKPLVGVSPIGVNVQWICAGSISDSNITEKNLIWLTGLRKNIKSCQINGSLNSSCQKNNPVFRSLGSC